MADCKRNAAKFLTVVVAGSLLLGGEPFCRYSLAQRPGAEEGRDDNGGGRREGRRGGRRGERRAMDPADYARGFIKDRDKNGNGKLDGEELEGLRGPMAGADLNGDKEITVEEYVASRENRDGGNSQPADARSAEGSGEAKPGEAKSDEKKPDDKRPDEKKVESKSPVAGGSGAKTATRVFLALAAPGAAGDKAAASKRRSYRFTPPTERAGLPEWIKSRDKNNNGQVEMSEFTRSWSERAVRDFRRYDQNDDGVVTAKEVAAAEKK